MASYRILYVDDDADIREIALMSLQIDPELDARSCASGRQALVEAQAWRPDLVLLDVMMPDMDGPATLEAMRKLPGLEQTPVVFITARTHSNDIQRFLALGATGVIAKPFDPLGLAITARNYLLA